MRRLRYGIGLTIMLGGLALVAQLALAQQKFTPVTGKAFDDAVPAQFYLEGKHIPVQARNAVLVMTPAGKRVLFALLDTTGYSSQIRQKYEGMVISEGSFSVCGQQVGVGSYGFGRNKPAPGSKADAQFFLYSQAGEKVLECAAKKDSEIKQPVPLQVLSVGGGTRLYLNRYWLPLE